MNSIEKLAITTYQKNLHYLKEKHRPLYDRVNLLTILIEEGKYKEKFVLEYKDEGYFDVQEIESQAYLYKMNSTEHSVNLNKMIDKKRTGAIFKASKQVRASDRQAEIIDRSELSFHNYLWASIKLINYVIKYATPDSYMRQVHKVIFIGTGLGLHIENIVKKLQAQIIFIKESNLELFRLSLFTINYHELSLNRSLHFSILENEADEQKSFVKFLNEGNNYNLNIKHIPFSNSYKTDLQQLQKYVLSQSYINYGYNATLLRLIDSPKYLVTNHNFLNVSKRHQNNIFSQKPILLLFSGPSTSNNIKWVKEHQNNFIIISALSTCKLLQTNNIKPDIVVHIDPGEATKKLFENIDTAEYFKDCAAILAPNVTEHTMKQFKKSTIHFIEQGTKYKKDFGLLTAPSVGEYTYALSLIFGAQTIYLLGIDLALDNETLQSHGDFHIDQTQGKENVDTASLDPDISIQYIRGNFLEQVPSVPSYLLSIEQFEYFSKHFKLSTQNVYNLSNGAYLNGAEPLKIESKNWSNLEKLNKKNIKHEISQFLMTIGSTEFRDVDRDNLSYQLQEAKKIKKRIIKHQKQKTKKLDSYLTEIATLGWDISDMEYKTNSDLAQVYYEYFQTIQSYIFDLFNTQGLNDIPKHITEVDNILNVQLLKLVNTYIKNMEKYI